MRHRDDLIFSSTKTYTHSIGLSCCFRQWRAKSHCRYLHGYALEVRLVFTSSTLDERNWVVDFGSLKPIKQWLEDTFDHKLLVARDDPFIEHFQALAIPVAVHTYEESEDSRLADIRAVDAVGCEAFSFMIYEHVEKWLADYCEDHSLPNAFLESVEVKEHQGNSAICRRKPALAPVANITIQPNHKVEQVGDMLLITPVKDDESYG